MDADNDLAPAAVVEATALPIEDIGRRLDQRVARAVSPPLEFDVFFHANYRTLLRGLMYVGATKEEAEDAISDAMLEILRRWDDLKQVLTNPVAYVRRAAFNSFIGARRRERRRAAKLATQPAPQDQHDDPGLTLWEDRQWVAQLLGSLPPRQREVMALIVDGIAAKDIADLLGRTPDAVRQNLWEARRRLKAVLGEDTGSENNSRLVRKEER